MAKEKKIERKPIGDICRVGNESGSPFYRLRYLVGGVEYWKDESPSYGNPIIRHYFLPYHKLTSINFYK